MIRRFAVWFITTSHLWEARHTGRHRPFMRLRLALYRFVGR